MRVTAAMETSIKKVGVTPWCGVVAGLALVAALLLVSVQPAQGQSTWDEDADGNWNPKGIRPKHAITREDARDPRKYAAAKEAAAKDGMTVTVIDDDVDPTIPNTGKREVIQSKTFTFDDDHERVRWVRADMETAAKAGSESILFRDANPRDLADVQAYLRSLVPQRSPHLVEGKLSRRARQGKLVFERPRTGCVTCHPRPLFTDLKLHDVGTRGELEF